MVKNLDTKEIWEFSKSFVRREGILVAACLLAAVSSLAAIPKAEYIDWHVLVLLYCLMLVVGGLKKRRILDHCAVRLLQKCVSLRQITAALLLVTFVSSMLVTNDVALITFDHWQRSRARCREDHYLADISGQSWQYADTDGKSTEFVFICPL